MADATAKYESAAPRWGDKMRVLGYYDGYLGFLSEPGQSRGAARVLDIGAGTGAFAEAWVAVNGAPDALTLLDPSRAMLAQGRAALAARGVAPALIEARLGEAELPAVDVALAAHVLEHCDDPLAALVQIRRALAPGGRLHLVVSKPHWCNAIIWFQWRHRTFRKEEITSLLQRAGFEIERVYAFPAGPPSRTSRGIVATRR